MSSSYANGEALRAILSGESDQPELDIAALELARIEFPQLSMENSIAALDAHAQALARRIPLNCSAAEFVAQANSYLFREHGFGGNDEDYYNPRNSCLNHVLMSRRGIPITLSVLYMEVGRRLGRRLDGIGLPGHFIVGCSAEDGYQVYVDAFHGGDLLTPEACRELARRTSGLDIAGDLRLLQPVTKRQILVRMLHNLKPVYFRRRCWDKCLAVLNLILLAQPDAAVEYRQRAGVLVQLHQYKRALEDLETYLKYTRDSSDANEIEQQMKALRRLMSSMN